MKNRGGEAFKVFPCFVAFDVFCFLFHHKQIMRPLLIAVLFFALSPPNWCQQQQPPKTKQQTSKPLPLNPSQTTIIGQQQFCTPKNTTESDNKTQYWPQWFWPPNWSNWVLAGAAIWAGCIGLKNLKTFKVQTRANLKSAFAAKLAAEAARDNARALINAERAWIVGGIGDRSYDLAIPFATPRFELEVKNVGRTPGTVRRLMMEVQKHNSIDDLPDQPDIGVDAITYPEAFITSSKDSNIFLAGTIRDQQPLTQSEVNRLQKGDLLLVAFGVIEYEDVIEGTSHETWFCFSYAYSNPSRHGFQTCLQAPASYRQTT